MLTRSSSLLRAYSFRCSIRSHSLSGSDATYVAFPCGFGTVLIYCLPSPCTRLSRARTTTEAPPPVRDIAGLGGLLGFACPALESRFSCSKERTLDALGGRLYPWQLWPRAVSGHGRRLAHNGLTQSSDPNDQALTACSLARVAAFVQRLPTTLQPARPSPRSLHHGTFGNPPRTRNASSRAVKAVRLLQAAVPISATFTAPFCIRPDPDEDDFFRSSVPPLLHDAPTTNALRSIKLLSIYSTLPTSSSNNCVIGVADRIWPINSPAPPSRS